MKKLIPAVLLLALVLTSCSSLRAEKTADFFAMDTYMSVKYYGGPDGESEKLETAAAKLEKKLSVTKEDSEIARLNRDGRAKLSGETEKLLTGALDLCRETEGALDVTVYPAVRAWGFTTGEHRVPDKDEIDGIVGKIGYGNVTVGGGEAALPDGYMVDLGAVAKGYLGDKLAEILKEDGVTSALLDLGGNIRAVGEKPDGSPWRIAVRDPAGEGVIGTLPIRDETAATSGGYERYFVDEDGEIRWHIIDPATGYPAKAGLISVTVIGKDGSRCDGLSTALFVMGREKSVSFWRERRDFEMILVTDDGKILISPGLSGMFEPEKGSSYSVEVIGND